VFIHADGAKKSISAPGVGNYLTVGKAAALTRQLIGEKGLREHSFVHAHGTGTPQNRVTESVILDRVAEAFGVRQWPVTAIKAFVGHSLGSAGGDQLAATLGSFAQGILPGIRTIDHIASDVHRQHLDFAIDHVPRDDLQASLINSKGFGGNNATAVALSARVTEAMLQQRHGSKAISHWQTARDTVLQAKSRFRDHCLHEAPKPVYRFNEGVMGDEAVTLTGDAMQLNGGTTMPFDDDNGLAAYQINL